MENTLIRKISNDLELPVFKTISISCPKKCLASINKIIAKNPSSKYTIIPLLAYRMSKWALSVNDDMTQAIQSVEHIIGRDENFTEWDELAQMVSQRAESTRRLSFANRDSCIEKTKCLTQLVEYGVQSLGEYPKSGRAYRELLTSIHMTPEEKNSETYLKINKHYEHAITALHSLIGPLCHKILSSCEDLVFDDRTQSYLYHNTQVLLERYSKYMWHKRHALTIAEKSGIDDVDSVIKAFSGNTDEAINIIAISRLVETAINKVRSFPDE